MLRIKFFLFYFFLSSSSFAQLSQLQIEGKAEKVSIDDIDVKDSNGRICSAIQIVSSFEDLKYDSYNGVVKKEVQNSTDIIYLSPDERVLVIYKSGYEPLKIILSEIGIKLRSKQVWRIRITGGKFQILLDTSPGDSINVSIDGKLIGYNESNFICTAGIHELELSKQGYVTVKDTVDVSKNNRFFKYILPKKEELVFIKGGWFTMGKVMFQNFYSDDDEKPLHPVMVRSYYIGKYEVTFEAYVLFCEDTGRELPGDLGWGRQKRPVINVNWYDAVEFCNWLSKKEGLTLCYAIDKKQNGPYNRNGKDDIKWTVICDFEANGYRLSTEAEWEYAARERGRDVRFGNGKDTADFKEINYDNPSPTFTWSKYPESFAPPDIFDYPPIEVLGTDYGRKKPTPVGSFLPNALGIYDMAGNVLEWCWDWYDKDYYKNSPSDKPTGPKFGSERVLRGGSWNDESVDCRNANRSRKIGNYKGGDVGFRVVRSVL